MYLSWMSLKDVHVYLPVLVYTLKEDMLFSAYQWVQLKDNTSGDPLSSLNADNINMMSSIVVSITLSQIALTGG